MFEIALFATFEILIQVREGSFIWGSLIWSTPCEGSFRLNPVEFAVFDYETPLLTANNLFD